MPITFRDVLSFPFNNGKGIRGRQVDVDIESAPVAGSVDAWIRSLNSRIIPSLFDRLAHETDTSTGGGNFDAAQITLPDASADAVYVITATYGGATASIARTGDELEGVAANSPITVVGDLRVYDGGPGDSLILYFFDANDADNQSLTVTVYMVRSVEAFSAFFPTATQAEAEAGTVTDRRAWTPQRVAQAIAALATGGGDGAVGPVRAESITFTDLPQAAQAVELSPNVAAATVLNGASARAIISGLTSGDSDFTIAAGAHAVQLEASGITGAGDGAFVAFSIRKSSDNSVLAHGGGVAPDNSDTGAVRFAPAYLFLDSATEVNIYLTRRGGALVSGPKLTIVTLESGVAPAVPTAPVSAELADSLNHLQHITHDLEFDEATATWADSTAANAGIVAVAHDAVTSTSTAAQIETLYNAGSPAVEVPVNNDAEQVYIVGLPIGADHRDFRADLEYPVGSRTQHDFRSMDYYDDEGATSTRRYFTGRIAAGFGTGATLTLQQRTALNTIYNGKVKDAIGDEFQLSSYVSSSATGSGGTTSDQVDKDARYGFPVRVRFPSTDDGRYLVLQVPAGSSPTSIIGESGQIVDVWAAQTATATHRNWVLGPRRSPVRDTAEVFLVIVERD